MQNEIESNNQHVRWISVKNSTALYDEAYRRILTAAANAIEQRGCFLIVLAGGNTPISVYQMLRHATTDWSRWHVYFGDERCLPKNNNERNSQIAANAWLNHVPIPLDQIYIIPGELGADQAALFYARTLRNVNDFDLVLLGLGEDGHTASLFPLHDWGTSLDAPDVLAVCDAPKPPMQRVTLSAKRLNYTRAVLFLVGGKSKQDALLKWRSGTIIPACAIQPKNGVDVLVESTLLLSNNDL